MGRRKSSVFEDIIEITAMLPWWVGILLALVSYLGLHVFVGAHIESSTDIAEMGGFIMRQLMVSAARIFQYILPVMFTMGSVISLVQQQKKNRLYGYVKKNPAIRSLKEMNWQEFELFVGRYFEGKGYSVRQFAQPGPDGGVDLVVMKDNEKYLVQCKQWRSVSVGVKVVRELLGAIVSSGAVGGFVVSSGKFTRDASEFVKGTNIQLIDGREIINSLESKNKVLRLTPSFDNKIEINICPRCRGKMVLRTAKRGANAGKQFWGCAAYPNCRGTRSL